MLREREREREREKEPEIIATCIGLLIAYGGLKV